MKEAKYFQCQLSKGSSYQTAYIEERGAVVGNEVEIGGYGTKNFWKINVVGSSPGVDAKFLKGLQNGYHKGYDSIKPRISKTE